MNKRIYTTLGAFDEHQIGIILPHEHVFVDQRLLEQQNYLNVKAEEVIHLLAPEIEAIRKQAISLMVECTPVGVGRRVDLVKALSDATSFPFAVATGVYREPWVPQWVHDMSEDGLVAWMTNELLVGIEDTGVKAGWIKLSAGDEGLTPCEEKILRAASLVGIKTGAVIGSHTSSGKTAHHQLDIIENRGYSAQRFIWIHTQKEKDFSIQLELAARGAYIEYDNIGSGMDEQLMHWLFMMLEAGYEKQILLSQDRGWYNPSQANGGTPKPYTHLMSSFVPKLKDLGIDQKIRNHLLHDNPFNAFSR